METLSKYVSWLSSSSLGIHCMVECTTPILKETGCHHMMVCAGVAVSLDVFLMLVLWQCISPGCNTHFCYVCGGMIVRSALNHEIDTAVSEHYSRCQLFEVPN